MDWLATISDFIGTGFSFLERLSVIRVILGFIIVFFLPGFIWSLIFFRQINFIERIVLSLGLSIVSVTLSLLFLSRLMGMKLNGTNSILVIAVLIILPLVGYYLNKLIRRKKVNPT